MRCLGLLNKTVALLNRNAAPPKTAQDLLDLIGSNKVTDVLVGP